jgi:glycosyltransferase involved in cell wall biosynthesis
MAAGKYICFLDVDDYWLPCKLLDQYNLLSKSPELKLIFADYYKADSSLSFGYLKPRIDIIPIKTQACMWNPVPNLTSCVARDVASMFRFNPVGHEDFLYWHQIIQSLNPAQIGKTDKILAIYRTSAQSTSGNKLKALFWWMRCYSLMGHPLILAILLLLLKAMLECGERFSRALGLIPTIQLTNFADHDLTSY